MNTQTLPNHDFTNAKVGDKIYTIQWGEGTIFEICPDNFHSVRAKFKSGNLSLTIDGKNSKFDRCPTAFTEPVKIVPASYEPFVEQEMMVWDDDIENAKKRVVFANPRGKFVAYGGIETIEEIGDLRHVIIWQKALPIAEWETKVNGNKNAARIKELEAEISAKQSELNKLKGGVE